MKTIPVMIAQGSLVLVFFGFILLGVIASILGLIALIQSFGGKRYSRFTLACALPPLILGFLFLIAVGRPKDEVLWPFVLNWLNLLFGIIVVIRWIPGSKKKSSDQ